MTSLIKGNDEQSTAIEFSNLRIEMFDEIVKLRVQISKARIETANAEFRLIVMLYFSIVGIIFLTSMLFAFAR